jgi:hypothetical protein
MKAVPHHSASFLMLCLSPLILVGLSFSLHAQTAVQTASAKPAAAVTNTASGFSIETEMLTYRALESNGEAIACDVAAYLYGTRTDFKKVPTGAICNVGSSNGPSNIGVVILPFDRNAFADFQIWRSDMQTMAEFEQRGNTACNATPKAEQLGTELSKPSDVTSRGLTPSSATASSATLALGMLPGGNILSATSGVLGLFASSHEASPVGGTIEDQAFMDNVSRELRTVNISVMMPSVYTPYGLTSVDPARSPFFIALDKLLHTRDCLVRAKGENDPDVKSIDGFLAVLSGPTTTPKTLGNPSAGTSAAAAGTASNAAAAQPATSSHLEAILSADGLAQRLGVDPATGKIPDNAPQHLLLIKALESGGSVNRTSNIFGTKMSYSGGSVGTYALFDLNGQLECSGNVFDYAGSISGKHFQKQLHAYMPDPAAQVIFQRGSCRVH